MLKIWLKRENPVIRRLGSVTTRILKTAGAATASAQMRQHLLATIVRNTLILLGIVLYLQTGILLRAATPAFVQEKENQITSGQTNHVVFSSSVGTGHLIVVFLIWDNTGPASVSDSLGNTYFSALSPTRWSNTSYSVQTFYAINALGGSNTVTATYANSVTSFGIAYAHEYSGVLQTAPVDVTAAASGTSGSLNSGSATTTNAVDLLFAGGVSATNVTSPGSGYTARSTAQGNITEDRTVSAVNSYNATASNQKGAWAMQMVAFRAASGTVDNTPPTTPSGLSVTGTTASTASLSWTASTDNVGVAGYKIFRAGVQVGTSATNAYTDTGLAPSTTYSYTVSAYDAAGNNSAQSSAVQATTKTDTTPPTVPTGLSVTGTTVSTVSLSWNPSTDNFGVAGYKIYRAGAQVGTSNITSYTDTGLAATTTYSYTVSAYDAAGNNFRAVHGAAGRHFRTNRYHASNGSHWTNGNRHDREYSIPVMDSQHGQRGCSRLQDLSSGGTGGHLQCHLLYRHRPGHLDDLRLHGVRL